MKSQLNKIYIIFFIILFFTLSKSYAIDNVSEFTDAINEASEKFNNISEASTEQSKIIDEAFKEIDKATEYVQEAINNNNAEDAIKTLEFIEKSLSDVQSIIPQEFSSDMSNIDTSAIAKEDMNIITEMTSQMGVAKEKKQTEFMSDLMDLNLKGIDTVSISENLNGMGIDTIKLVLDVDGADKLETWTKEQWAQSYTGSIITSSGNEAIPDNEIGNKVVDLKKQLQVNNDAIFNKKNSLTELQTKIDPLSNKITGLQTQKSSLLAKYNEEILKQSSSVLSNEEINQSKELADQFNNQMNEISNEIKFAEEQSSSLQQQVQGLNLELTNEIANKTQLQNNIRDLNNQLSANQDVLSQKTFELDRLKNTDLNTKVNSLNEQLQYASRERDFIESNFEKSIDLEVDATEMYYSALGNIESDYYDDEVNFSIREVGVIMDSDPRKHRAFELEKYATYAGFSDDYIQKGIEAINNDDWDKTKDMYKEITKKLSKNSEWVVDTPSNAEINVMIEEEKAIQAAALASMGVDEIKSSWNTKINEQAKEFQPLAGLNTTWIKYSSLQSNTVETDLVAKELDKILNSDTELKNLTTTFEEKQKQLKDIQEFQRLKTEEINEQIKPLREQVSNAYTSLNDINRTYNQKSLEKITYINSIGGYAALQRDKGNSNYGDWTRTINDLDQQLSDINNKAQNQVMEAQKISSEIIKIQMDNSTPNTEINNWINLQNEVRNLSLEHSRKLGSASEQARSNIIKQVEEATAKYNEIISQENPDLKAVEDKVIKILKEVPTFANNAESVAGLDPATLRAKLIDLTVGNNNETAALNAARDAVSKIGKAPVSEFMKGPYWEMTNVKAAAIVRSKKYSYVDDYEYINAYYEDRLNLNSADREYVESELKNLLSKDNVKLQALNNKVSVLSNELNLTQEQSQNLTTEMAKLENELSSLKNSESEIQTQISDLSNQFNSKESLITEKTQNLASLQEQLNPINDRMNNLQGQRAELDTKLNDQLNTIASQIESQGQSTEEANTLKNQFESQISQLDNQIKEFENQSNEINSQLTSITTELSVLETENPELANQIVSLNQDLKNFTDIKADLAMATAKKLGINVDENTLKSVKVIDGKVIIAIEGTNLISVVDQGMLIDNAQDYIDPLSELSVNTKVYTTKALNRELVTPEFIEAAKSISVSKQIEVIAQSTAVANVGATTEQSQAFAAAKAARLSARKDWDAALASGDKVAAQAAENAFMAAKSVEQTASLNAAAAVAASSVASQAQATTAATEVAQVAETAATEVAQVAETAAAAATEAAQEVSQIASAAAQEAASEVKETVQAAAKSAQQAALDALWEMEALPGSSGTHTMEVTAAIRQIQAEMNGNEFNYLGAKSYEEAMEIITENADDPNKITREWDYEKNPDGEDPNKMGKCGQASC
jgi:predicted  nucleic acid-binding Zn-ribbon protein